ncbi:MAG: hypothetical protein Q7S22_00070 [Candidatus Micrarchaeota archaeon]|nr:hypothetical protein [Candidatus Micrarchaeota archaeon]
MVQKLKDPVEEAVIKAERRIVDIVSQPIAIPVARELEKGIVIAQTRIHEIVNGQGKKVNAFLENAQNEKPGKRSDLIEKNVLLNQMYNDLDGGNEKPPTVFKNEAEAAQHSKEIYERFKKEKQNNLERALDTVISIFSSSGTTIKDDESQKIHKQVQNMLAKELVLVPKVTERLTSTPPILTVETIEFERVSDSGGQNNIDTNHIMIGQTTAHNEKFHRILHENLHYAAYLGGGYDYRWRNEQNEPAIRNNVIWFHEGLTELTTQDIARKNNIVPDKINYVTATITAYYIQQLGGKENTLKAYLTGDLTEVRSTINQKLGAGTLEQLLDLQPREALKILREKVDTAGIDRSKWDQSDLVQNAIVSNERLSKEREKSGNR